MEWTTPSRPCPLPLPGLFSRGQERWRAKLRMSCADAHRGAFTSQNMPLGAELRLVGTGHEGLPLQVRPPLQTAKVSNRARRALRVGRPHGTRGTAQAAAVEGGRPCSAPLESPPASRLCALHVVADGTRGPLPRPLTRSDVNPISSCGMHGAAAFASYPLGRKPVLV